MPRSTHRTSYESPSAKRATLMNTFVGWILGVVTVLYFFPGSQVIPSNKDSDFKKSHELDNSTSLSLSDLGLVQDKELSHFLASCDFLGDPDAIQRLDIEMRQRGLTMKMMHLFNYEFFNQTFAMEEITAMKLQLRVRHYLQPMSERKKHAIIIPYRQREHHLKVFREFMSTYLPQTYPNADFSIWVIEQDDAKPFMRAWLANVGFSEVIKQIPDVECVTLHDVDLIPDTDNDLVKGPVWYDHCSRPTLTGSELEHFPDKNGEWWVPYRHCAGGIVTMHQKHWKQINGYSNDYVGWGGEDDDLNWRFKRNGLHDPSTETSDPTAPTGIRFPPKGHGRFRTISQSQEHHTQDQDKFQSPSYRITTQILTQMQDGSQRYQYDGLSDLQYTVSSRQEETFQTNGQQTTGRVQFRHIKAKQHLLEFVHIPKSAGSAIEKAAAKAGVQWGACHWDNPFQDELHCPQPANFQNLGVSCGFSGCQENMWLIPSHLWKVDLMVGKKTFCVVRNPYDRVISLFYDPKDGYKSTTNDTRILNDFVQDKLQMFKESNGFWGWNNDKWMVTQSSYAQGVDHVLKYENLKTEFGELMQEYDLTQIKLDGPSGEDTGFHFQVSDFNVQTIEMIEQVYGPDFDKFGYGKVEKASLSKEAN